MVTILKTVFLFSILYLNSDIISSLKRPSPTNSPFGFIVLTQIEDGEVKIISDQQPLNSGNIKLNNTNLELDRKLSLVLEELQKNYGKRPTKRSSRH